MFRMVSIFFLSVCVALTGSACGPSAFPGETLLSTKNVCNVVKQSGDGERTSLRDRMDAICTSLLARGFTPNPASKSGKISDSHPLELEIRPGEQRKIVIVALPQSEDMNLDLEAIDAFGNLVAEDSTPDKRAVIGWTAEPDEEYTVRLEAVGSKEGFLLQTFTAPVENPSISMTGFFDIDPKFRPTWSSVEERMELMGFGHTAKRTRITAVRGERFVFPATLSAGLCTVFVAQGSAGIDRLELRLEREQKLVIADLAGRSEGWVRYCAEQDSAHRLVLKIIAGSGTVRIGEFSVPRDQVLDLVGPPLNVRPTPDKTKQDIQTGVENELMDRGYQKSRTALTDLVSPGDRLKGTFTLDRRQCAAVFCTHDPSLGAYDVQLFRGEQPLEAYAFRINQQTLYGVCASDKTKFRFELVALTGTGNISLHIAELRENGVAPDEDDVAQAYLLNEAAAGWSALGMVPVETRPIPKSDSGQKDYVAEVFLDETRCYGLSAISYQSIERFRLYDSMNREAASWAGPGHRADMAICPLKIDNYNIKVTLYRACEPGQFPRLQVFATHPRHGAHERFP